MNERIREFAEQAGWDMGDEVEGFNIRLEKFAQLIVRECADIASKDRFGAPGSAIKDHFGVEE